ncbi:MAG: hypothetical protein ACRELD_08570 [Longimicrobiales bacterium]
MRTRLICLLALIAMAPLPVAGQRIFEQPPPRFEITPFFGWRLTYEQTREQLIFDNQEATLVFDEVDVSGAPLYGLEGLFNLWGPWSLVGSLGYVSGSDATVTRETEDELVQFSVAAGTMWLLRANAQFRFPENEEFEDQRLHTPEAFIFAGPTWIRTDPAELQGPNVSGLDYYTAPIDQLAVNIGIRATSGVPWWENVGFHLVAEDFITFWNDTALIERDERLFRESGFANLRTDINTRRSHIFAVRAGLSWRFGAVR